MKPSPTSLTALALGAALICSALSATAATRIKANNTDDLNLVSSWVGTNIPGANDIAQWDNTVTAANTVALGGDATWSRLNVVDPGGDVTINGPGLLTINNNNTLIALSPGTANLTVNCDISIPNIDTLPAAPAGQVLTYNGIIIGRSGSLFLRNNSGELRLGNANSTHLGNVVQMENNGPSLGIGASSVGDPIASGPMGTNDFVWNGGGTSRIFAYNGPQVLGNHFKLQIAPMKMTGTNSLTFTGGFDFGGGDREIQVLDTGALRITGIFSNANSLLKTGPGPLELGGTVTATFLNGLHIRGGTLRLIADDVIPDGSGRGGVYLTNDAVVLDLNGHSDTINGLAEEGGAPSASFVDNTATNTDSTLTIGMNNASSSYSGTIRNTGANAKLHLVKIGTGTLTLRGTNTYTGATTVNAGALVVAGSTGSGAVTVNAGTLSGTGTIGGAASIVSGSTLVAGTVGTVATLTFNSSLALAGTTLLDISKNGGVTTADKLSCSGAVTFGGALTISKRGTNALAAGDSFDLFDGTLSGVFADGFTLPGLANGLKWNTNNLAVDGTITVESTGGQPPSGPVISNPHMLNGIAFVMNLGGGTNGGPFTVFSSTVISMPRASWTMETSGVFDGAGAATVTIPVNPAAPYKFYLISEP